MASLMDLKSASLEELLGKTPMWGKVVDRQMSLRARELFSTDIDVGAPPQILRPLGLYRVTVLLAFELKSGTDQYFVWRRLFGPCGPKYTKRNSPGRRSGPPAAAPGPGPHADPPRVRDEAPDARSGSRRRRQSFEGALGTGEVLVEARCVTVSRSSRRRTPATSSLRPSDQALGVVAGRPDRLVTLAAGPAALLVRGQSASAALPRPGLASASAISVSGGLDRRERLLEGLLLLGQACPRVGDDRVGQAESLGDGEGLTPAGQADREPVRRRRTSPRRTRPTRCGPRASCGRRPSARRSASWRRRARRIG